MAITLVNRVWHGRKEGLNVLDHELLERTGHRADTPLDPLRIDTAVYQAPAKLVEDEAVLPR